MFTALTQIFTKTQNAVVARSEAVELWVADATNTEWLTARIHVLTEAERTEFAKISDASSRWIAMSARITLRVALSEAVDGAIAPCDWEFVKGACGKKEVAPHQPKIHFSVSHNEEAAVIAISRHHALGVDIEATTTQANEDVIEMFFSAAEQASLDSNIDRRSAQFVRFWTLKEAYTKMTGEGFTADFATVEFDAVENTMSGNDDVRFETFNISNGQIALAIDSGFAGEVAIREIA